MEFPTGSGQEGVDVNSKLVTKLLSTKKHNYI